MGLSFSTAMMIGNVWDMMKLVAQFTQYSVTLNIIRENNVT